MEKPVKTTMMGKILRPAALAASCLLAAAAGCGAQPTTTTESSDAIAVADLPSVGGCETLHAAPGQVFTLTAVKGYGDLVVVRSGGQPVCIDSLDGAQTAIVAAGVEGYAASNPMPGDTGKAASNPMPGDTGQGTAASNPMPGVDPGSVTAANPTSGHH